jgi:hypothetical protein
MQAARQDTERNADAPPVVHRRTIATLRTGTCTITAADSPCPTSPTRLTASTGTQVRTKLAQLGFNVTSGAAAED